MSKVKSVCVYCGSSRTSNPVFNAPTAELAQALAADNMTLVYGGGSPGLMGLVASSCMDAGGKVIGIIPDHILRLESRHQNLTELHVVDNMHIRKQMMAERADAFVILPGGIGTLDETFEILTWKYLGIHDRPVILANFDGYWDTFLNLFDHMDKHGFTRSEHRSTFVTANTVSEVMDILRTSEISEKPIALNKI